VRSNVEKTQHERRQCRHDSSTFHAGCRALRICVGCQRLSIGSSRSSNVCVNDCFIYSIDMRFDLLTQNQTIYKTEKTKNQQTKKQMVAGGIQFGDNDNKFVFKLNPLSKTRMSYMMSIKGRAPPANQSGPGNRAGAMQPPARTFRAQYAQRPTGTFRGNAPPPQRYYYCCCCFFGFCCVCFGLV
jgi:hypothetical protein